MTKHAMLLASLLTCVGSAASANDRGLIRPGQNQQPYTVHGSIATSATGRVLRMEDHGFSPNAKKVTAYKTGYGHTMLIDSTGRVSVVRE